MHKPDLRALAVSTLIVDPDVQRSLDGRRVQKIADDFQPNALGTVTVSHRANGSYHIIDGQHRVSAVRIVEGDNHKVMCRIFDGLKVEEEAEMFRLLNNTAKPEALDIFRVRVVEQDPIAVAIVDLLSQYGWKVAMGSGNGIFAAVASFERLYRADADAAEKAISTTTRAWGHDAAAADGRIVEGIGRVYARYGSAVVVEELTERLTKYPAGSMGLLGKARGLKELVGGSLQGAIAELVVETYNKGRRTRAVQPWRSAD